MRAMVFLQGKGASLPTPNCYFLIHRVAVAERDLPFDLLAHGERVDEAKPLIECGIHAVQPELALRAHRDGMHLSTYRAGASLRPAPVIDGDAARPSSRQFRTPSGHLGGEVQNLQPVIPEA